MIVHRLGDDRLLCINQTTHALMAADICRRWGNEDFVPPAPYGPVLTAIGQHDNGWVEWEARPRLREDGYPMDFVHGPDADEKLALWTRGIARVEAQHPYAALLIGEHAARLYSGMLDRMDTAEAAETRSFIETQQERRVLLRRQWGDVFAPVLTDAAVDENTRLLQFGDTVSLQLCMPWSSTRTFPARTRSGDEITLTMTVAPASDDPQTDGLVSFAPWPFECDEFIILVHGRLLGKSRFADDRTYRKALAEAQIGTLAWRFARQV